MKYRLLALMPFALLAGTHAFSGSAPASPGGGVDYWVREITDKLDQPTSIIWLPGGDMLVPERSGHIKMLRRDGTVSGEVAGLPASYNGPFDGIRDVVLDPDFGKNRLIYIYLMEGSFESRRAAVYRGKLEGGVFSDARRIFQSKDTISGTWSFATRMILLRDGTLLMGIAEDHTVHAQDLGSHIGKTLRINRDGSIPGNNPFRTVSGALPEIWTYGHRTPSGFYQEADPTKLWEVEIGPRGGDEINLIEPRNNYGWAKVSMGFAYNNGGLLAPLQSQEGMIDPVHNWTPSVTPAGIMRYEGTVYPGWRGDLFVGNLTGKAVRRLRVQGRTVMLEERMLSDLGERIRDVKTGPDGKIYVVTDGTRLLRLEPGAPRGGEQRATRKLAELARAVGYTGPPDEAGYLKSADVAAGKRHFMQLCSGCHSIEGAGSGGAIGPDLTGVYRRNVGTVRGYRYSDILNHAPRDWDHTNLDLFLKNPASLFPGTAMPAVPLNNAADRRDLIAYLKFATEQSKAK